MFKKILCFSGGVIAGIVIAILFICFVLVILPKKSPVENPLHEIDLTNYDMPEYHVVYPCQSGDCFEEYWVTIITREELQKVITAMRFVNNFSSYLEDKDNKWTLKVEKK